MAVKLNLLPPELSVSKSLGNLIKTVRIMDVIGVAAFLVFTLGIVAFYVFSLISLNSLNTNIAALKAQISAQEKTEQQIVLLEDRLDKAAAVLQIKSSYPNLIAIEPFLAALSGTAAVNQTVITSGSLVVTVNMQQTSDVVSLLGSFQSSSAFKSSGLTVFNLNPKSGYLVEIGTKSN